jgi:hypothetical protein
MQTIAFSYPRRGLQGVFATFRLGHRWAETLTAEQEVELIDARTKRPLLRAKVLGVKTGELLTLAQMYSKWAHNWREHPEDERSTLLLASMRSRFKHWGPHRTADSAPCSVIFLKELPCEKASTPP